jgi:hypothetical protein
MPSPKGVPLRLKATDVLTILRRAARETGAPLTMPPGQDQLRWSALLNPANDAVARLLHRYHGLLAHSILFTGGGLRFVKYKVGVQSMAGSVGQAAAWAGPFSAAYGERHVYKRRLYGKAAMPALPATEVLVKQAELAQGHSGAYLCNHLSGPDVKKHLQRVDGSYHVADPGVQSPLVYGGPLSPHAQGARFISLARMYQFMRCAASHRKKPPHVVATEAEMSRTNPRRHGVLGFSEYAGALAKVLGYTATHAAREGGGCAFWLSTHVQVFVYMRHQMVPPPPPTSRSPAPLSGAPPRALQNLSALQAFYQSPAREQEAEYAHAKRDSLFAQILHDLAPHKQVLGADGCHDCSALQPWWRRCVHGLSSGPPFSPPPPTCPPPPPARPPSGPCVHRWQLRQSPSMAWVQRWDTDASGTSPRVICSAPL